MELHLTAEIAAALIAQAQQQGPTPEQLALDELRRHFVHPSPLDSAPPAAGTLADWLAGFIGVLHSGESIPGGAALSAQPGDAFTRALLEKRRAGRL